jgi:hypothetical protein
MGRFCKIIQKAFFLHKTESLSASEASVDCKDYFVQNSLSSFVLGPSKGEVAPSPVTVPFSV